MVNRLGELSSVLTPAAAVTLLLGDHAGDGRVNIDDGAWDG